MRYNFGWAALFGKSVKTLAGDAVAIETMALILSTVNFEESETVLNRQKVKLSRGQLASSPEELGRELWTYVNRRKCFRGRDEIRRALRVLEKKNLIKVASQNGGGCIITVLGFDAHLRPERQRPAVLDDAPLGDVVAACPPPHRAWGARVSGVSAPASAAVAAVRFINNDRLKPTLQPTLQPSSNPWGARLSDMASPPSSPPSSPHQKKRTKNYIKIENNNPPPPPLEQNCNPVDPPPPAATAEVGEAVDYASRLLKIRPSEAERAYVEGLLQSGTLTPTDVRSGADWLASHPSVAQVVGHDGKKLGPTVSLKRLLSVDKLKAWWEQDIDKKVGRALTLDVAEWSAEEFEHVLGVYPPDVRVELARKLEPHRRRQLVRRANLNPDALIHRDPGDVRPAAENRL